MATTNDIVDKLASEHGLTKAQGKAIVEDVFAAIAEAAAAGEAISLPGFGKFKVKHSAERTGRNPATGSSMTIAASRKLAFTPSKTLKDRLKV